MLDPLNFVRNSDGVAFVPDFIAETFIRLFPDIYILDFNTQIHTDYIFAISKNTGKRAAIDGFLSYLIDCFRKKSPQAYVIY
jgi:DNA-binding transcriptional LysR family regulator